MRQMERPGEKLSHPVLVMMHADPPQRACVCCRSQAAGSSASPAVPSVKLSRARRTATTDVRKGAQRRFLSCSTPQTSTSGEGGRNAESPARSDSRGSTLRKDGPM
jgi:hypothetical protein